MTVLAAACQKNTDEPAGAPPEPVVTAETLGSQDIMATAGYLTLPPYDSADREKGRKLAQLCRACHTLDEGGADMIGPNLYGFFGAKAGTRPSFQYSDALKNANFVWTPRALDAWLREPARFLPGNRMTFVGVSYERDRKDLIAYLLEATDKESQ